MTGPYAVQLGDCLELLAALPAGSMDCVITDPPYAVDYRGKYSKGPAIANDSSTDWLAPVFAQIARVLRPDSVCVSFYGWPAVDHFMRAWRLAGLAPVSHLVWLKNQIGLGYWTRGQHEQAYVLAKGNPRKPAVALSDVLPWTREQEPEHPTQKPIDAMQAVIERFVAPGATVLDPFMGSGSTGVAALRTGRRFVGMEIDPGYFAIASRRLADAAAQPALIAYEPGQAGPAQWGLWID